MVVAVVVSVVVATEVIVRGRGQKKTGLCGKNSQTGGVASDPNPLLDV